MDEQIIKINEDISLVVKQKNNMSIEEYSAVIQQVQMIARVCMKPKLVLEQLQQGNDSLKQHYTPVDGKDYTRIRNKIQPFIPQLRKLINEGMSIHTAYNKLSGNYLSYSMKKVLNEEGFNVPLTGIGRKELVKHIEQIKKRVNNGETAYSACANIFKQILSGPDYKTLRENGVGLVTSAKTIAKELKNKLEDE